MERAKKNGVSPTRQEQWDREEGKKEAMQYCSAQCKKLQGGDCNLPLDDIKELLDKTDWDDLDKGELLTPYIMKGK